MYDANPELRLDCMRAGFKERKIVTDLEFHKDLRSLAAPVVRGKTIGPTVDPSVPADWPAIPDTRKFVYIADKLFRKEGFETKVLIGPNASEEALIQMHNPRFVLFSTHGYFMNTPPPAWINIVEGRLNPDFLEAGDPLHRSMLILAGANQRSHRLSGFRINGEIISKDEAMQRGHSKDDLEENRFELGDGLLTAYEILGLDLRDTELVMLTACESGLGVVQSGDTGTAPGIKQASGEVVAGLRQALHVAGSQSVIMSMWQVPVQPTLDQMEYFLRFWIHDKLARYDAFHKGQIKALENARSSHGSGHPFWWAGFVYIGDPGENSD
jgi:CHAT domain-containing protein